MTEYRTISFRGVTLTVSNNGEVFRDAHTTVDRIGHARTYPRRKLTATKEPNTGYLRVGLNINKVLYNLAIHRLVAFAFIGAPKRGQVVNHINEDRTDNRASNLEWVTQKENIAHSLRLHPEYAYNGAKRVTQIKDGKVIEIFRSAREASRKTGLSPSGICMAARGVMRTCGGYEWRYV